MSATKMKVEEVAPNVFRLVGIQRAAHAYLLRGTRRVALVDTGLPSTTEAMIEALGSLGVAPMSIGVTILTHEHVDHAGGALYFAGHSLIAAHRQAAAKLHLVEEFSLMNKVYAEQARRFDADIVVTEGTSFDLGGLQLEAIHTPGHCSGAICLYEPRLRLLFSGDVVMANGVVGGVLMSGNISDYINSIERLQRLRIDAILPGHGKTSVNAAADLALAHGRLTGLLDDSHTLFSAMRATDKGFDEVMRSLRELNLH